jgi:hypothetical protein
MPELFREAKLMKGPPFTDSRLRIQWAKESLADFKRCAEFYFRKTPRIILAEPDPDGIHERHKIRFDKPFPLALTKHTVHAVEDLRSALDLAACDIARLLGRGVDDVHFPFCKSSTDFKSRINSACKDFPKDITDLFATFEPYSGGSDLLVAINELCNTSKHRLIIPVASSIGTSMSFETSSTMRGPIFIREGLNDGENEITFAITERGLDWKYQAKFSFHVRFGKVGAIEGRDVKANVGAMIKAVEIIVNEIEAKSRAIDLIS